MSFRKSNQTVKKINFIITYRPVEGNRFNDITCAFRFNNSFKVYSKDIDKKHFHKLLKDVICSPACMFHNSTVDDDTNFTMISYILNNKELINKFCDYAEELKFVKEECLVTA